MTLDPMRRWKILGLIALAAIVVGVPLHAIKERRIRDAWADSRGSAVTYVGRQACAGCHEAADSAWSGSDHDRALAVASDATVLGDFGDVVFEHGGSETRFHRQDGRFLIYTPGPDGRPAEFEVTHVVGLEPLQQYLVPLDGGRLQAFDIAWDVERREWFPLFPGQAVPAAGGPRWAGAERNWNSRCAECHSTNVDKGYDHERRTYSTTWSEVDVSCEACHGPGSRHVEWARIPTMARPDAENYELLVLTSDLSAEQEISLCAPCHARRVELGNYEHGHPALLQTMVPALLTEGLYYPDGQWRDEVYVYGSYAQSKMFRAGVACSDCHDVHGLGLLKEGNELCIQCHRASIYDTLGHHFHHKTRDGRPSEGALCVKCHMPETAFMVIDRRADHIIGVPRPDLSLELGVPNACNSSGCHDDRAVRWSAEHFRRWYGETERAHYGTAFAAARNGVANARSELAHIVADTLYPAIVRATALSLLGSDTGAGDDMVTTFERGVTDPDPLVRHTAVDNLAFATPERLAELVAPLLFDRSRAVRLSAAVRLAETPVGMLEPYQRDALDEALTEYRQAMEYSLDHAFAQFNLGNLHMSLRDSAGAGPHFQAAMALDSSFYPARLNLAIVYAGQGKRAEAETLLGQVLDDEPDQAEAASLLGSLMAEDGSLDEAANWLGLAADLSNRPREFFRLARVEQARGRDAAAAAALRRALGIEPDNLQYMYALANHYHASGDLGEALEIAERMIARHPEQEAGYQVRIRIQQSMQRALSRREIAAPDSNRRR